MWRPGMGHARLVCPAAEDFEDAFFGQGFPGAADVPAQENMGIFDGRPNFQPGMDRIQGLGSNENGPALHALFPYQNPPA